MRACSGPSRRRHAATWSFHATPGLVTTASFYRVRQPMYTDSVGAWQHYRDFLQPLLRVLEPG